MSVTELPVSPYLFSQPGAQAAPFTFTVPATLEVQIDSATATYDGTGAAGSFLPVMSFYSPSGVLIARMPLQSAPIAMGSSEEVSWFPFAPVVSGMSTGGGIQFDTYPQTGDWLEVETTGSHTVSGDVIGLRLHHSFGSGAMVLQSDSGNTFAILGSGAASYNLLGGGLWLNADSIILTGENTVEITSNNLGISINSGADLIAQSVGDASVIAGGTLGLQVGNHLTIVGLPSADPVIANAIWADNGVLVQSGHTVPGSGGIAFDQANSGGFLSVDTTTGDVTFTVATGFDFIVKRTGGATVMEVGDNRGLSLTLAASEALKVTNSSAATPMNITDGLDLSFTINTGHEFDISNSATGLAFYIIDDDEHAHILQAGKALSVYDSTNAVTFQVVEDGNVRMPNLPTSDPMTGDGALWVDGSNFVRMST